MLWTDLLVIQGSLWGSESVTFTQRPEATLSPLNTVWFELNAPLSVSVCLHLFLFPLSVLTYTPLTHSFLHLSLSVESAVLWTMDKESTLGIVCLIIKIISNSNSLCMSLLSVRLPLKGNIGIFQPRPYLPSAAEQATM